MNCTRCQTEGFLNIDQVPESLHGDHEAIRRWMREQREPHDVQVCDCCGDGEEWHGEAGEHDESDFGAGGPYAYNGGLPECY